MGNKTKPNFGTVMVYKVKFNFGLSMDELNWLYKVKKALSRLKGWIYE